MEDEEKPVSLLADCKLTICDKIPSDDTRLNTFLTDKLHFKINSLDPLVIEKEWPSPDDMNELLTALEASLQSRNTKKSMLSGHHRDLLVLKQKEGNANSDNFRQKSLLPSVDSNNQFTGHTVEKICEDCSDDASSQVQVTIDDVQELGNSLQSLSLKDERGPDHDESQTENSFGRNSIFQEQTNAPLGSRNIAFLEKATVTEKQEENSCDRGEGKQQAETTHQENFTMEDTVAVCSSANMQITQTNLMVTDRNHKLKQDSQCINVSSVCEGKLSIETQEISVTHTKPIAVQISNSSQTAETSRENNKELKKDEQNENYDSIEVKQSCIKPDEHFDGSAESELKCTVMRQDSFTSRQESPSMQNIATECTNSETHKTEALKEDGKQSKIEIVKKDQESYGGTRITNRTENNCTANAKERQPNVKSMGEKMITDSACSQTIDTKKRDLNTGDNQLNQVFQPAVSNREMDQYLLEEDKNENHRVVAPKIAGKQGAETRDGHGNLTPSVRNANQSTVYDKASQEHSSKQQEFGCTNEQNFPSEDIGSKSKQRELKTSKISSSNVDYSDCDAESPETTYSIKASSLDGLKLYFKGKYSKYFDDAKNEGNGFVFRLNSCNEEDVLFLKNLKQLKVEECEIGHRDIKDLKAAVKDIEVIKVNDSKVHIVGSKQAVSSAKKKLSLMLQSQDLKTNKPLDMVKIDEHARRASSENSQNSQRNLKMSRNEISNNQETWSQKSEYNELHQQESQACKLTHGERSEASAQSFTTFSRDSGHIFRKDSSNYYVRNERSTFTVKICKADITKLKVDCIVNAANKRLQHIGGVANAISSAAGRALIKECEDFIREYGQVDVTDIFISTGGNLPAKCVMHAVGPKWYAYEEHNKALCLEDLRHTVIRCLVEASRQGFTSIALPSISSAIFRVPKEACARCYMEAVKHFGLFTTQQTSLREIQFLDVDDSMVKIIQGHFEKNWTNPCDPHIVQRDCDFASTHFYSPNRNAAKKSEPSPYANKTASSSISTNTPGLNKPAYVPGNSSAGPTVSSPSDKRREESVTYQIGNFTLRTDSRPAFDIPSDITITVGKPFDKLSGLPNFSVSANKQKKGKESVKNKYTLFNVSKPKGHQHKLVCALLPEPDDEETIKQALENLWAILQSPNHKIFAQKIAKVILTSSILYKEPDNFPDKKIQHSYDRKKFGHFAKCLFEFLNSASEMSMISVTVVGSEEALLTVHRVMESRKVKKISPEAQQGARSKNSESSQHYNKKGYSAHHSGYAGEGSDYTRHHLGEGHYKASSMTMDSSEYSSLGAFSKQNSRYPVQDADDYDGDVGSPVDVEKTTCEICTFEKPCYPLKCCGKLMCQKCQNKVTLCPYCRKFWRVLTGNQPPGTMSVHIMQVCVAGFEQFPTLEITYFFPSGVQKDCHPNPGHRYSPMIRRAYLPANDHGFLVLKLLRLAFLRKLTFTIGRSLTTDRENSITWNDIHHKTSLRGGNYSYPDPNYLYNVTQELARKGVILETASADERHNIAKFENDIKAFGYFRDSYQE